MLGVIVGDVVGSVFERRPAGGTEWDPLFQPGARFTDDTVMTVATAEALRTDGDFAAAYRRWGRRFPDAGYGGAFARWLRAPDAGPYGSWGNGSAMRVAPVGWACATVEEVLEVAARSAAVTHDHPEGIRGAQAVALAVFLARSGADREAIRAELSGRFGYDLSRSVEEIRPGYGFDVSCQDSVPEAIVAFLDASGVEEAVRLAVSLGGDADTQAAIAGGIAEAFHGGVREALAAETERRLHPALREEVDMWRRWVAGGRV
jgi:ADP-ribosylglycohydrolase